MSIEDPLLVDAIGKDKTTGRVVLTISDHLPWAGKDEHLSRLDEKVRAYVGFIESGQLLDQYSDAEGRSVEIQLVCKYKPTDEAVGFLEAIREATERRGITFSHRTLSELDA